MLQQLSRHIKSNVSKELLPHEQFAYRLRHNCGDALALAINRWQCALDAGPYCGVALADLCRTFDRVLHGQLIECKQETEGGGTVLQ